MGAARLKGLCAEANKLRNLLAYLFTSSSFLQFRGGGSESPPELHEPLLSVDSDAVRSWCATFAWPFRGLSSLFSSRCLPLGPALLWRVLHKSSLSSCVGTGADFLWGFSFCLSETSCLWPHPSTRPQACNEPTNPTFSCADESPFDCEPIGPNDTLSFTRMQIVFRRIALNLFVVIYLSKKCNKFRTVSLVCLIWKSCISSLPSDFYWSEGIWQRTTCPRSHYHSRDVKLCKSCTLFPNDLLSHFFLQASRGQFTHDAAWGIGTTETVDSLVWKESVVVIPHVRDLQRNQISNVYFPSSISELTNLEILCHFLRSRASLIIETWVRMNLKRYRKKFSLSQPWESCMISHEINVFAPLICSAIDRNSIPAVSPKIANLVNLESLSLFFGYENILTYRYLSFNRLLKVPNEITSLPNLLILYI